MAAFKNVIVLVGLILNFFVAANALSCIHCRVDVCTHEYCPQAKQLFNSTSKDTGNYVEIDDWTTIPPCPARIEEFNSTQFIQTCSAASTSCGLFNYTVSSKNLPNIVPGENSKVPVVGGPSQIYESSIYVLGCVKPDIKCNTGLKQTTEVQNANSTAPDTKVNLVSSVNTNSECCKCEKDLCNKNEKGSEMKDCISKTGQGLTGVAQDTPFPTGSGSLMIISSALISMCGLINIF